MIAVFPFHAGDVDRLHDLLRWVQQLGGAKNHDALLAADFATPLAACVQAKAMAKESFREVRCVSNPRSVTGWPAGPNSLFRAAAYYITHHWRAPWLFMESDCVPLKPGWLDSLQREYESSKEFEYVGCFYEGIDSATGMPTRAVSGVAIYSPLAGVQLDLVTNNVPWDMANREFLIKQAKHTPLIHHFYGTLANPPTFVEAINGSTPGNALLIDRLPSQAVLFHRNKDGTLVKLLRQRRGVQPQSQPKCFICLGRFGDLMIVLPALRILYDRTGVKQRLMVSQDFFPLLDGVSYVEAVLVRGHWYTAMPQARAWADRAFGGGIVLQSHGINWGVDMSKAPNFQTSMWQRTGVEVELMTETPLVFDRRNKVRENSLASVHLNGIKPALLFNFSGISSPFPHTIALRKAIQQFVPTMQLVDLGKIRAERIYDLLSLYDRAACLLTTDTATLHLAAASKVPFIALKVGGWNTSVPVGNCVLQMDYSEVPKRMEEIVNAIKSCDTVSPLHQLHSERPRDSTAQPSRPADVAHATVG